MEPSPKEEEEFVWVTHCLMSEAPKLFDALIAAGVRFQFETPGNPVKNLDPVRARYGGTFGSQVQIPVRVYPDDVKLFRKIHLATLPALPVAETAPAPDWHQNLREAARQYNSRSPS